MKLFVWDFHGVLEKGNENAVLAISNGVLKNFGYKERFTEQDNLKLYGVKWYKYFEYLLPKETEEKHFELQQACIEYEMSDPDIVERHILPNDHAHSVLEVISKTHDQILVSNMSDIGLERFMNAVSVAEFFGKNKAYATNSHKKMLTLTKKELVSNYIRGKNFEKIIAIGDTAKDMEIGELPKTTTYLYAHPGRKYPKVKSHYKINDLREVLREL